MSLRGNWSVVDKHGYVIPVSRTLLLDMDLVEPTPAEVVDREAARAEYQAQQAEAWRVYAIAHEALGAVTDPVVRAVLDLHAPDADGYYVSCRHCVEDTEMGDPEAWPCETVKVVAKVLGVQLPEHGLNRQ